MGRADRQRFVRVAFPGPNLSSSDRASTNVREGHWFRSHVVASATELLLAVTRLRALSGSGSSLLGVSSLVVARAPTHSEPHSGSLLFRGLSPPRSACRLVAGRSLPAVCRPPLTRFPELPWRPPRLRGLVPHGDAGFLRGITRSGARSPLQVSVLLWDPELLLGTFGCGPSVPSAHDVGFLNLDSAETKSSFTSPRLQRLTGEKVWRPSPGLAIPLEVSSR